jgi:stage II sporulation protein D
MEPDSQLLPARPITRATPVARRLDSAQSPGPAPGKVWGHGHGMSQYGARNAAGLGFSHDDILNFYYPGTDPSTMGDAVIAVWLSAQEGAPLVVKAEAGQVLEDGAGAAFALEHPDGVATGWKLDRTGGRFTISGKINGKWVPADTGAALRSPVTIYAQSGVLTMTRAGGGTAMFRGQLQAVAEGKGLRTVNLLGLEDYVRSVVPAEMPANWPMEALKAQAIAARTYAAYQMATHGSERWHICETDHCQVYRGVGSEQPSTDQAVAATAGQVRTYQGQLAFTQFSASNGGRMIAGGRPYLVAGPDPWDQLHNDLNADQVAGALSAAQIASGETEPAPALDAPDGIDPALYAEMDAEIAAAEQALAEAATAERVPDVLAPTDAVALPPAIGPLTAWSAGLLPGAEPEIPPPWVDDPAQYVLHDLRELWS